MIYRVTVLSLLLAVHLLLGCDMPKDVNRYQRAQRQSTIQSTNRQKNQQQSIASDSPLNRFRAQVLLDTQVAIATSPSSIDHNAWSAQKLNSRVRSLFGAVQITPALIDAAVAYWAANKTKTEEEIAEAHNVLSRHFIRQDQLCFLLMVDAIGDANSPERWRLHLDPIKTNITIKTLSGEIGKIVVSEESLKSVLESEDGTNFCLCYIEDVVDEDHDPTFMLEWGGINYAAHEQVRSKKLGSLQRIWTRTTTPQVVKLQFETGTVHLLNLLEKEGIPWEDVYPMYIRPKYLKLNQSGGNGLGSFLFDKAFNFFVGIAVKKFP